MAKKDYISMRVDKAVHDHLKSMAARDHRTLSNMIYMILLNAVNTDKVALGRAGKR